YESMWLAVGLMFLLAVLGGWLMGYGVLRRIDSIRQTAGEIINGDLSQRMVVTRRNDEFDRLSWVLNSMLQRIENLMKATREVTDNLAHDLRNPLNRLRNRLDTSRFQPMDAEHFQQVRQDALQDVDDLIKTFNALLGIAQAESGVHRDDWTPIQLDPLISDLGELYEAVAEEEGIKFSYASQPSLVLQANRHLIAQVITNLLDNAVKYTPKGGEIRLNAEQQAQQIIITVSDTGPGIPVEERERVFKRFVRLDNARSTPGNGLGLSLVKAVADLHGAQVELADNQPGLKVILRFPIE
ncbi:MAG TPA: HAMP domain-containing sensor histidine kinase, partial [Thiolinea sp.]|nr:HAMP domain-containing sensor histidine kinase [Thiolinea sp.]